MKYGQINLGQIEAIINKLGGNDGALRFLRGETTVSEPAKNWHTKKGEENIIYFALTSDGTTGPEWIERLEKKSFNLSQWTKDILNSADFKSTSGITTEVAVLKGILFSNEDRITKKIRKEADKLKLLTPNAELACLIREKFSDKDIEAMGLTWIITMHEPIKDSDGGPSLLGVARSGGGGWLDACCDEPDYGWSREDGFVFVVSQVNT